ncbi:MAG: phosphoglucosamine mutase [Bacteroidales bacterium]|nr:phosphoglucosamine mutase [Bacteroidales bacterium]
MTLIKSISGIRGTIGGEIGKGLTPFDIMKYSVAFGIWVKQHSENKKIKIVVGSDARISGEMVNNIVTGTLISIGIDVINIGLATTPTTELAVTKTNADGGIILTASHNPKNWNALKLLNNKGEFLTDVDGKRVLKIAENNVFDFVQVDDLGKIQNESSFDDYHINEILRLPLVDVEIIKNANFKIAFDGINSVGGIIIPKLLKALGVKEVIKINCEPTGDFAHAPEPIPENLTRISKVIRENNVDLGFVVDPDVDRLAIINNDGTMFGEEYTIVAVADYVISNTKGNTVSNMSSSRALRDIANKHGVKYSSSAVGEVNVVDVMKKTNAIIGGEGNGGVIYPELHSGRDALVGIALFLTHLAKSKKKCSELRSSYPAYYISKNKIQLNKNINVDEILTKIESVYSKKKADINTIDGVKIDFDKEWIHLRKSNTEPIIRIYSESITREKADLLAQEVIDEINKIISI